VAGRLLAAERLAELRLIASELVTNSVMHAGLDPADSIGLTLEIGRGRAVLTVRDDGPGFVLTDVEVAPRARPGGRGLAIVAYFSSQILTDQPPGQVTVEIVTGP
jgi:anti-sigma regulatory factor (Ser/Thr protein kinase)